MTEIPDFSITAVKFRHFPVFPISGHPAPIFPQCTHILWCQKCFALFRCLLVSLRGVKIQWHCGTPKISCL